MDSSKVEVDSLGNLYPIAKGVAYVKVTVTAIEKSFLVKVTVGDERKATTFTLDKTNATVSNAANVDDEVTLTATVKDQYNADFDNATFVVEGNSTLAKGNEAALVQDGDNTLVFNPAGLAAGTYSYKITVEKITRVVTFYVKAPGAAVATPKFVVSDNTVDLAVNKANSTEKNITFALYKVDAKGVKVERISNSDYTIEVKSSQATLTAETTTSGYAVKVLSVSNGAIEKEIAKTGTYVASVTYGGKIVAKASVVVTDTQVKPVVSRDALTVSVASGTSLKEALKGAFTVSTKNNGTVSNVFSGIDAVVVGSNTAINADTVLAAGEYKVIVKTVNVDETFGSNVFTHEKVAVNQTVTITVAK